MRFGKVVIKPWMGIFGLLGFLGFAGVFTEPVFLVFFGFFGFFAFYWEGKLAKELQDERLNENRNKALQIAYPSAFAFVFASMILIGNFLGGKDPARAYALLNLVIAVAFAASQILSVYLAYRFDKNGCGDE